MHIFSNFWCKSWMIPAEKAIETIPATASVNQPFVPSPVVPATASGSQSDASATIALFTRPAAASLRPVPKLDLASLESGDDFVSIYHDKISCVFVFRKHLSRTQKYTGGLDCRSEVYATVSLRLKKVWKCKTRDTKLWGKCYRGDKSRDHLTLVLHRWFMRLNIWLRSSRKVRLFFPNFC